MLSRSQLEEEQPGRLSFASRAFMPATSRFITHADSHGHASRVVIRVLLIFHFTISPCFCLMISILP